MLASKKAEEKNEDLSSQGYAAKQRQAHVRARKINFSPHQQAPKDKDAGQEKHGGNWSANSEVRGEPAPSEKKIVKPKKVTAVSQPIGNRIRGNKQNAKPANPTHNNLNKYRIQIRKFLQNIEEYRKLEDTLKSTHDTLMTMRKELLDSEVEPGDIPDVQSSIHDIIQCMANENKAGDRSRLVEVEKECSEVKEAFSVIEEEKKKLEETLSVMNAKLKCKEEELIKVMENDRVFKAPTSGEGDIDEVENLKKALTQLDQENSDLMDKLKNYGDDKSEEGRDDQKIKSLEKLIETLHVDMKRLKDHLKVEKECRSKLEVENEKLRAEVSDLKSLGSSSDTKDIIIEKDNKIQDLMNRLNEVSRVKPLNAVSPEVFKVDFSADTPSLVNQLAKFVQLYEELSREGFDLETKLKDAHMEIYRLEQILEKQLSKIKEQDDCLKNMEQSLSKVVVENRKNSRLDQSCINQTSKCKCDELEMLIKEKEEFSERLKEKMSLLYQKYKQYKSECNLMRKQLDAFEKRSWLKKLVNI